MFSLSDEKYLGMRQHYLIFCTANTYKGNFRSKTVIRSGI